MGLPGAQDVLGCRYGAPIYWSRDDASGVWNPSTDCPPGEVAVLAKPAAKQQQQQQQSEADAAEEEDAQADADAEGSGAEVS